MSTIETQLDNLDALMQSIRKSATRLQKGVKCEGPRCCKSLANAKAVIDQLDIDILGYHKSLPVKTRVKKPPTVDELAKVFEESAVDSIPPTKTVKRQRKTRVRSNSPAVSDANSKSD